jgi:hypothetical protein
VTPTPKVTRFAAAVMVAFVAGCGGGGDHSSLVPTSKCLVRTDGATVDFVTPLHEAVSGGALRVVLPTNEVQLGFGKDGQEARDIGDEVKAAVAGTIAARNYSPDELVAFRKNVVLVWKAPPSEQDRNAVESCLEK